MSNQVRIQLIKRSKGVNNYVATDLRGREYTFNTRREVACKHLSSLEVVGSLIREHALLERSGQDLEIASYYLTNTYLLRQAAKKRKELSTEEKCAHFNNNLIPRL